MSYTQEDAARASARTRVMSLSAAEVADSFHKLGMATRAACVSLEKLKTVMLERAERRQRAIELATVTPMSVDEAEKLLEHAPMDEAKALIRLAAERGLDVAELAAAARWAKKDGEK